MNEKRRPGSHRSLPDTRRLGGGGASAGGGGASPASSTSPPPGTPAPRRPPVALAAFAALAAATVAANTRRHQLNARHPLNARSSEAQPVSRRSVRRGIFSWKTMDLTCRNGPLCKYSKSKIQFVSSIENQKKMFASPGSAHQVNGSSHGQGDPGRVRG